MQRLLALPHPPTAVFARNDFTAIGAMSAARDRGVSMPRRNRYSGLRQRAAIGLHHAAADHCGAIHRGAGPRRGEDAARPHRKPRQRGAASLPRNLSRNAA